MSKRKETQLQQTKRLASEMDERRQTQIGNQVEVITRMLGINRALKEFIEDNGLAEKWEAERERRLANQGTWYQECYICGHAFDHYGEPHGIATGDNKTRADHDQEVADANNEPTPSD